METIGLIANLQVVIDLNDVWFKGNKVDFHGTFIISNTIIVSKVLHMISDSCYQNRNSFSIVEIKELII